MSRSPKKTAFVLSTGLVLGAGLWLLIGNRGPGPADGGALDLTRSDLDSGGLVARETDTDAAPERVATVDASARAARRSAKIRGRVLRADGGSPVAGVEVAALDRHPAFAGFEVRLRDFVDEGFWKPREIPVVRVLARTRSAADGSFEIEGLPRGRVFLDARSSSWYTMSHPGVRLARGESSNGVELLVSPGGRVRGRVVDGRGEGIAHARVVLRPSVSSFLAQLTSRSYKWSEQKTVEDGSFDFAGVPPGEGYAVTAISPGAAIAQVRRVSVARGRETELTLRAGVGAKIHGTVRRPDGKPAAGALVAFAYLDISRVLFSVGPENPVRADDAGRFELPHVAPGQVVVSALQTDYSLAPFERLDITAGASYEVDLELSIGSQLSGLVVDSAGRPVEGAKVSARTMDRPQGFDLSMVARLVRYEDTTDAEGRFVLRGIVAERMFLTASHPGYEEARASWRKDRAAGALKLVLERGAWVAGRVVDKAGRPITRFRVRARPQRERRLPIGPRWGRPQRRANPYTDRSPWLRRGEFEVEAANGEFRVGPLPGGKTRITVDAEGYVKSDDEELELEAGKDKEGLVFTLAKGAIIKGRVVARGGAPVGEAQVTWRKHRKSRRAGFLPFEIKAEPEDLDFMAMDATFGSRSVMTNTRGEFELRGVATGKINVTARHPAFAKGRLENLEVGDGETKSGVVLELAQGGAIEGTVTGLDGKPTQTATIVAFSIAAGVVKSATTDSAGFYRITALTPGSYVVFKTTVDGALTRIFSEMLGSVRMKSASVREGRTSRVDIEDRRKGGVDVYGRITVGNQPAARAVVTLLGQDRSGPFGVGLRTATADDAGNYEIASVMPGTYVCQITRFAGRRPERSSQPLTVEKRSGRHRLDLQFPTGELRGVVVDASGQPISGVRLRAVGDRSRSAPGGLIGLMTQMGGTSRGWSGEHGEFVIKRLPPGRWTIRAEPRGDKRDLYGSAELADVDLTAGGRIDGLRVVLPMACLLEGRVVDGLGQPVSAASVRVVARNAKSPEGVSGLIKQFRHVTRTGGDGRFRLRGLMPGSWSVIPEKKGLTAAGEEVVELGVGRNPEVSLTMVRGAHLKLRVLGLDGKALARGQVRVLNSSGKNVGGTKSLLSVMAGLFRTKRADGGSDWIDYGLQPPDTYTLEVTQKLEGGKSRVRTKTRTLREGEDARWEVKLSDLVK